MRLNRYLLGYDTFFRHKRVAGLCGDVRGKKMLDVGGGGYLSRFFAGASITTLNLDHGDVIGDGRDLPFDDNSFDLVVSLDVLEHVAKPDRAKFVDELFRVAKDKVVICAALGTPKHEEYARQMLKTYRMLGKQDNKHLEEHIDLGMPTLEDVRSLALSKKHAMLFENILGAAPLVKKLRNFKTKNDRVNKALGMFQLMATVLQTLFFEAFVYGRTISSLPSGRTNRFYLVIDK
ncbi:MAG: class I SAM-dependent methyltransferase [Candidatus Margulisbacteria bacterium]|nr:class I SAM-dependent methyltransferase [Candidatus Margulisiibacteriota bacterium]